MINANELRIGNWVKDRGGKNIRIDFFEHLQIGYDCKFGMINSVSDDYGPLHPLTEYTNFAKPIPLTPEILEKCGFESSFFSDPQELNASKVFKLNEVEIYQPHEDANIFITSIGMGIYSVHALQNLYFALTGEELNYTP